MVSSCEKPTKDDIKELISNYNDAQEELAEEELAEEENNNKSELLTNNECPNAMVKVTQNDGSPFCVDVNVYAERKNLYDAYNFCKKKNSDYNSKSYFGLISNQEWMLIAKEIETNLLNWSSRKIGKGKLISAEGLLLKSGKRINDLSNKPQWIDWVTSKGLDYYPSGCGNNQSKSGWIKFNQENKLCDRFDNVFAIDEVFPLFPSNHSGELRILEKHHSGKFDNQGILRGASLDGKKSGLYNLDLGVYTFDKAYFRCMYRF